MKNVMIGIFILGFTSFTHAQSENVTQEIILPEVTITVLNSDYLRAVQDNKTPFYSKALENKVANFNLKEASFYCKDCEFFEVNFKNRNGSISAIYDYNGDLVSAFEVIKDVSPPGNIRYTIYKENPDWTIVNSTYTVSYNRGIDAKRKYKAKLTNGEMGKTVKFNLPMTSNMDHPMKTIVTHGVKI